MLDRSVDYLIIQDTPKIAEYTINPICTHLGCTVKSDLDNNHFICDCHESQYDSPAQGVHAPAKRYLPLITGVVKQNQIRLVDRDPAVDPR
ncbi:Rieske 2Fe-2S domain-containing protein [Nostoc flagelliforme]|uniref:Rieske 2Fe-2S domain-containing protein n=1 Tax=Nostoc flagelliforme TaxID=1306274 RepID=UPI001F54A782|nr:Rieske 2Fe-2S domain-containing protein [Nostoc flagelliforme]